jgi:hypothetical protein
MQIKEIFWLPPCNLFSDSDWYFGMPHSTLRLHIDTIFGCQPGKISSTLTLFLDATLDNTPADRRNFWLPAWTITEDIESLFWVPPSKLRLNINAKFG